MRAKIQKFFLWLQPKNLWTKKEILHSLRDRSYDRRIRGPLFGKTFSRDFDTGPIFSSNWHLALLSYHTTTPELIFVNCKQQINNYCALYILQNIECFIEKTNELTSGHRSRHFNVGIRRWFGIEDATDLRALIVDLLLY